MDRPPRPDSFAALETNLKKIVSVPKREIDRKVEALKRRREKSRSK